MRRQSDPTHAFSREQVASILNLSKGRLRYWERLRLVRPRHENGRPQYSLQDLIVLRAIVRLTSQHVPAVRLRRALRHIADRNPMALKKPLLEMRLLALGGHVVEESDGGLFETASGQRVIDLDGVLSDAHGVRALLSVHDEFEAAIRLDRDPQQWPRAALAYRNIIRRVPDFVEAYINLGTLEFKRGHLDVAEACYREAVSLDPKRAVAHFNLANVIDERGRTAEALAHLLLAVDLEPADGDIRFNLALLLDKLGRPGDAHPHWIAYLEIDPHSEWAMLAREHLARRTGSDSDGATIIPFHKGRIARAARIPVPGRRPPTP